MTTTFREDYNFRYHRLSSEFKQITGVPAMLQMSFTDHGEPIVMMLCEAIKDFLRK